MRHEASFLRDIVSASPKIEAITAATSEESFLGDEVLPAAVLHHLTVMGEAISRLWNSGSDTLKYHGTRSWPCATGLYTPTSIWTGRSCGTPQWMTSHSYAGRSAESSKASFRNRSRPDAAALARAGSPSYSPRNT